MFDSHPLLDIAEGMEGEWREGGGRVGLIERIIADILTIGDAALSALRRTGGGEEIAEFSEDSRIRLLSLHIACVFVLQSLQSFRFTWRTYEALQWRREAAVVESRPLDRKWTSGARWWE